VGWPPRGHGGLLGGRGSATASTARGDPPSSTAGGDPPSGEEEDAKWVGILSYEVVVVLEARIACI
jgi:hypothetical protein